MRDELKPPPITVTVRPVIFVRVCGLSVCEWVFGCDLAYLHPDAHAYMPALTVLNIHALQYQRVISKQILSLAYSKQVLLDENQYYGHTPERLTENEVS